jgi:hypothetical protein
MVRKMPVQHKLSEDRERAASPPLKSLTSPYSLTTEVIVLRLFITLTGQQADDVVRVKAGCG